jgi:hypothetical protein
MEIFIFSNNKVVSKIENVINQIGDALLSSERDPAPCDGAGRESEDNKRFNAAY